MNRRDLLKMLGGAVAATAAGVLVPEDTVRKTYFLPPKGGWTSWDDLRVAQYKILLLGGTWEGWDAQVATVNFSTPNSQGQMLDDLMWHENPQGSTYVIGGSPRRL